MGAWAILLMAAVGLACAAAAVGLAKKRTWGRFLAISVLVINSLGDLGNIWFRHDYRALIGLPIAGGLIAYLSSRRVRAAIAEKELRPKTTPLSKDS
jgi:hypothetical protein